MSFLKIVVLFIFCYNKFCIEIQNAYDKNLDRAEFCYNKFCIEMILNALAIGVRVLFCYNKFCIEIWTMINKERPLYDILL